MKHLLEWCVLPMARLELPGWGRALRLAGVRNNARWVDRGAVCIRGKRHGYRMKLELSDWSDRLGYFLGRFYELDTQLLIEHAVFEGDVFIDVGANVGMVMLTAARQVGPTGRVIAFEPNPTAADTLVAHVRMNDLGSIVAVHRVGLSDERGQAMLNVFDTHTGSGTMAPCPADDRDHLTDQRSVPVLRGDEVISDSIDAPVFLKIDVEGYESRVLKGMSSLIRSRLPAVLTEANRDLLARAGTTFTELADQLLPHGYRPYELGTGRKGWRHVLRLTALRPGAEPRTNNVLWLIPGSAHASRLDSALVA